MEDNWVCPLLIFPGCCALHPYIISGGGTGLHWDELDEDISVPALLVGIGDRTRKTAKETA
jgi:hypothetical protein